MTAEFTLPDGNPVRVNMANVDYIQPADDGALIVFMDGRELQVTDDYEDVVTKLEP